MKKIKDIRTSFIVLLKRPGGHYCAHKEYQFLEDAENEMTALGLYPDQSDGEGEEYVNDSLTVRGVITMATMADSIWPLGFFDSSDLK